jgi:8-oxo-dGTP pyrophosphatase MutT (NUDIX family)
VDCGSVGSCLISWLIIKKNGDGDLPIEVLNRYLACENSKFFVYFDHVIDKAGSEVRDYLVVSPKDAGKDLVAGVGVLPVFDRQVGLIRIYRPAIRAYSWEILHGFVDEGESEKESALRELQEEAGLIVDLSCFSSLGYITPDTGIVAARIHLFVAEGSYTTQKIKHELGLSGFHLFSFIELEEMFERSKIQDTFTLAAWCKYQILQNTRRSSSLLVSI